MSTVRITDGEYHLSTDKVAFGATFRDGVVVAISFWAPQHFVGQPIENLIRWLHSQVGGLRMEKIK